MGLGLGSGSDVCGCEWVGLGLGSGWEVCGCEGAGLGLGSRSEVCGGVADVSGSEEMEGGGVADASEAEGGGLAGVGQDESVESLDDPDPSSVGVDSATLTEDKADSGGTHSGPRAVGRVSLTYSGDNLFRV